METDKIQEPREVKESGISFTATAYELWFWRVAVPILVIIELIRFIF